MDGADITILDGALGTELQRRGVHTRLPLWSTWALLEAPEIVREVHGDYLRAGARLITTATFRTQRRTLDLEGMGDRASEITRLAVDLAREARDALCPEARVLGSVAPLEDCYEPGRAPSLEACRREHAAHIANLLDAGVDALLIETMGTIREAVAASLEAHAAAPGRWMLSVCCQSTAPAGVLLSGETLERLFQELGTRLPEWAESARGIGVNCVAAPALGASLRELRRIIPGQTPLLAYANVGAPDPDVGWRNTDAVEPARYADYAGEWTETGATIVGGCCGTTPETIRAVVARLRAV